MWIRSEQTIFLVIALTSFKTRNLKFESIHEPEKNPNVRHTHVKTLFNFENNLPNRSTVNGRTPNAGRDEGMTDGANH